VPLVIAGTGESQQVGTPVGLRELAPTIAEIAGVEHSFTGRNLLDLGEKERPWITSKVFANGERRAAVRSQSGKYVTDGDREELYDLSSVPSKQGNRIEDSVKGCAAFDNALLQHVASEQEKRAVRAAREEVSGS